MTLRYGSLFSGYGGLDLGLQAVLGGSPAWHVEFDKHPSAILAHHWPDVPNYGDVTKVDWSQVEPVDVLTGGSPCQDLSHAGKRAGMTDGTRSNLWVQMREAIAILRPRLVVWENVRGALSAPADSGLESCPRCVGDPRDRGPVLRALGRVVGDLSELGYVGWWHGLRAADVGAAHGRFRVFLFAVPADSLGVTGRFTADIGGLQRPGPRSLAIEAQRLLPTPVSDNSRGLPSSSTDYASLANVAATLLPTPQARDHKDHRIEVAKHRPDDVDSLNRAIAHLPAAHGQISGDYRAKMADAIANWGDYAPAIARWEAVIGRPAPAPTEPGPKGNPRLSAHFVEWLMGLPEGHVTGVDIPRNAQLKALGNGVVWQQCAAATRWWLEQIRSERDAA